MRGVCLIIHPKGGDFMGRGILTGLAVVSLLALVGGLAISAFASQTRAYLDVDYEGGVIYDQRYGEAERNLYDLYLPRDTSSAKAEHLVLFIHGGSWSRGDKEDTAGRSFSISSNSTQDCRRTSTLCASGSNRQRPCSSTRASRSPPSRRP